MQIVARNPELNKPMTNRKPLGRSIVAMSIARLLWSQHRRENDLPLQRIEDADKDADVSMEAMRFREAANFITNFVLSPDRAETAILAMADVFCSDNNDPELSIFKATPRTQAHYYHLAVSAFNALKENVREVPPDWHYRDALCRLLDAIVPKEAQL